MTPLKLKPSVIRFNSTLTNAAKKLVGRTKPGKRSKPWLTATVKAKIKLRNRLRRKINEKRKEWREACKDVNEAINRAKEESWREVLMQHYANISRLRFKKRERRVNRDLKKLLRKR